jgi:hypothetical protein
MGLFDVPAPVFAWLDNQADSVLPPVARLVLWGALSGATSMLFYRMLSAQNRIRKGKQELSEARRNLDAFDGKFTDAFPMIRRLLKLSCVQVGRVGWPAILSSLPMLFLLSWLAAAFGYIYPPPGVTPIINTQPPRLRVQWISQHAQGRNDHPSIIVSGADGKILADVRLKAPFPIIAKRRWWNFFMDNPAGYLPEQSTVDHIEVALARKHYLSFGPDWIRGWEPVFFAALLAVTIVFKVTARIE